MHMRLLLALLLTSLFVVSARAQRDPHDEFSARFDSLMQVGRGFEELLEEAEGFARRDPSNEKKIFQLARVYDKMAVELNWSVEADPNVVSLNDSAIKYYKILHALNSDFHDDRIGFHTTQFISHCYGMSVIYAIRTRDEALLKRLYPRIEADTAFPVAMLAYGRALLEGCDKNAILFVAGDDDTFPLYYLQAYKAVRRDVTVINTSMLALKWYATMIREGRKEHVIPAIFGMPSEKEFEGWVIRSTFADTNGPKKYTVDPQSFGRLTQVIGIAPNRSISMMFPYASYRDDREIYYSTAMVIVSNIIEANRFKRPVYFSYLLNEMRGAAPFCRIEGPLFQLLPIKQENLELAFGPLDVYADSYIDSAKTRAYVFDRERALAMRTDQRFYSFGGNNIIALGVYANNVAKTPDEVRAILEYDLTLPQAAPNAAHVEPVYAALFDLALENGLTDIARRYLPRAERALNSLIEKDAQPYYLATLMRALGLDGRCTQAREIYTQLLEGGSEEEKAELHRMYGESCK
jgi:hypothetical protein